MIEQGTVAEVADGHIVVKLTRHAGCDHCRICVTAGDGAMRVEVDAFPEAKVGDRVDIDMPQGSYRAALLLFALPMAMLVLGATLGSALGTLLFPNLGQNLPALILAGAFFLLSFLAVRWFERRRRAPEQRARITRIVSRA